METSDPVTIVMIADVCVEAVQAFQDYERNVLPLLQRHDGRLERRLRTPNSLAEVHIVSFATRAGYESYMTDPERLSFRQLLDGVEVRQRLLEASDVPPTS